MGKPRQSQINHEPRLRWHVDLWVYDLGALDWCLGGWIGGGVARLMVVWFLGGCGLVFGCL